VQRGHSAAQLPFGPPPGRYTSIRDVDTRLQEEVLVGVREQALARLAERQTEERAMVRAMTKRLDAAQAVSESAREALAEAQAARAAVLVEWGGHPGWTAASIAEHAGLPLTEVTAAIRAARRPPRSRPSSRRAASDRRRGHGTDGIDGTSA
jgi:CTP:molybdopterin cytidylyltransferase MocA